MSALQFFISDDKFSVNILPAESAFNLMPFFVNIFVEIFKKFFKLFRIFGVSFVGTNYGNQFMPANQSLVSFRVKSGIKGYIRSGQIKI